jgi:exopolysaccharide production protein ExoQ
MLLRRLLRTSDFLLVFNLFFFANASAFFSLFWLSPEYITFEFLVWVVLAVLTVWKLNKNNLLANFIDQLKRNWTIFPFLIFAGVSIFWSVDWQISLFRWLTLVFVIIAGEYIGLKYDLKRIIDFLSVFAICILLFAAFLVFFVPDVGVMNYHIIQGAWRGMYWHKNHLGLIATFFNILFLVNTIHSLQSKGKQKTASLWGLLYLVSLLFVYQSDSVAAYLTTIFLHGLILLALLLLKFGRKIRRVHFLIFLALLVIFALLLFSNLDFIFGIFNRNTSLTGRVPMWTYLFNAYISERPLGGYGFNAFWHLSSHQVAVQQAAGYPDPIIIADNGFIDILVNTGFIGLVLFLIFYFRVWWRSVQFSLRAKDIIGIFPVILMSYTLVANLTWSLIFESEGFFLLLMVAVLFSISPSSQKSPALNEV